jgi:hypothetical protein
MKRLILLLAFLLILSPIASADDDDDDDDDNDEKFLGFDGEDLGEVAQYLLIGVMTIVIWKPGHIWLQKNAKTLFSDPKAKKKLMRAVNKIYMRLHYWAGLAVVIVGGIHGLTVGAEGQPILYWSGWAGLVIMSISGGLLLWKWPPRKVRKGARLLHAQRAVSVITIILLLISHA